MLGPLFMIWFWATPVAYTINLVPDNFQWIVRLNPAYYMLEIYRDALYYGKFPESEVILPFLFFSLALLVLCMLFYQKTKRGFGELL